MDPTQKGKLYSRIFRKAGVFLGKGEIQRAIETLKEGESLATQLGDHNMAQRFTTEIQKIQNMRTRPP